MIADTKQLWDNCLTEIEMNISKANFTTWFKNTSIIKEDAGTLFVGVPNEFVKDWLNNKFHKLILKTLMNYEGDVRSVEYIISKQELNKNSDGEVFKALINKELPLSDLYINKDDNLNPKYNFNSFIVGSFNELAYAVAQAIIAAPGESYNPFFVYGGTGLGKTHMIQAIGNNIKIKDPSKKIYYVSLERFAMDYINSVQNKNTNNTFKEKYRKYDVIIMDDIQFISGKDKTQEELFHLFNIFHENNKQIIFSSDKHPNFIQGLEDRLQSRFASGMTVQITEPDYESRVAIIKAKLQKTNSIVEPSVVSYLAEVLEGSIRELEGSVNSIVCQSQLKNKSLSLVEAKTLIKNNIKPKKTVAIKDVVKIISDYYGIPEETIYEKTRRKEIVRARQIAMYLLREDFNISYPLIGQKLGGRDHTTVIHSHLKIKTDLKSEPALLQEIERIRIMFK